MRRALQNYFNGLAFGITETVPGVSGGTIAIILGFYDELIRSVNHFTEDVRKYLKFLAPLCLGIASGILLFSSMIHYLLTYFSFPTMLFFIGLIVGIIPLVFTKVRAPGRSWYISEIMLVFFPMLLLVIFSHLKGVTVTDPALVVKNADASFMLFVFFAGIIAAAALVIPGVSGSFILLLLGIYPVITYSVSNIRFWLTDMGNLSLFLDIVKILGPLALGVAIGGLSMARLLEKLFKHYYRTVYAIILGLLIGSVYTLSQEPLVFSSGISPLIIAFGVATFSLGAILSFHLGKKKL